MSNGLGGFLVSASIVVTGLTGVWAWPILQEGGAWSLATRFTDLYHRTELRLRPAIAALQSPPDLPPAPLVAPGSISESLPPAQSPLPEVMTSKATAPVVPAQCHTPGTSHDTAVIGDRVQLRIFEGSQLAGTIGPDGTSSSQTDIVFERLDLSGTYEIGSAGTLSLPAIGHVDAAGYSLSCIEAMVARAAYDRLLTQDTVSASYAARPPILIRGAVRAPGAHGYSPGLTVERVLAQAGAVDSHDPAAQVRLISLSARRTELDRTRISLSLERMRVEAALNDRDSLPEDHPTVRAAVTLFGNERVASERSALFAEIEAEGLRQARTTAMLADLDARIKTARDQHQVAATQMDYYANRHEHQSEMLQSGFITDSRLNDSAVRTMDAERVLLEKEDLLLRLQAERRMAEQDAELSRVDRLKTLTAELRRISTALDSADSEAEAVLAELNLLQAGDAALTVTIERPAAAGTSSFTASADTPVRPGDLVTVTAGTVPETDLAKAAYDALPAAVIRSARKE